jgi:hypothetical protein
VLYYRRCCSSSRRGEQFARRTATTPAHAPRRPDTHCSGTRGPGRKVEEEAVHTVKTYKEIVRVRSPPGSWSWQSWSQSLVILSIADLWPVAWLALVLVLEHRHRSRPYIHTYI